MKKKLLRALILLAAAACSAALFSSCAAVDDARAHQAVSEDGGETYTIDGVVYKALISQFTARPTDFDAAGRVFITKPDVPTLLARSYHTTIAEINDDRTILWVDYRIFIREDKYDDYKTLLNETDFDYYGTYMLVEDLSDSHISPVISRNEQKAQRCCQHRHCRRAGKGPYAGAGRNHRHLSL